MGSKQILIVEDQAGWRDQLASPLRRDGYAVTAVENYGGALEALRQKDYQLLVIDLSLKPGEPEDREGLELLKDLAGLKIPAIVMTGVGTLKDEEIARREGGALSFLEKQNFDISRFRQEVREALRKAEEMEKELATLRARFLRGEIINLTENPLRRAS